MKKKIVLVLPVNNEYDRQDLEMITDMDFNSIQAIRDKINGVECFTLTEFMDACNDTDDDTPKDLKIDISENWIGYVNLIK
jgi:hypothetical protein